MWHSLCVCVWFRQLIVWMALCQTAVDLSATSNYTHTLLIHDVINNIIREVSLFLCSSRRRVEGGEFQLHCFMPSPLDRGDWLCLMSSKSANYQAFDFNKTERLDRIVYTAFCFSRYFKFKLQDPQDFVQFL